jgi:hypothetical protein
MLHCPCIAQFPKQPIKACHNLHNLELAKQFNYNTFGLDGTEISIKGLFKAKHAEFSILKKGQ